MDPLSTTASVFAVVQVAGKVWSLCWKYCSDAKDADSDINHLMSYIEALQTVFEQVRVLTAGPNAPKLTASKPLIARILCEFEKELQQLCKKLEPGKKKLTMKALRLRDLKWPLKKEDVEKTIRLLDQQKTSLILAMNCDQTSALHELGNRVDATNTSVIGVGNIMHDTKQTFINHIEMQEQHDNLSKLPYAKGAAHDARIWEYEDHCLPDTRVQLRQRIMEWCDDPDSECIFWLSGMAGTGKSTISRTIAHDLAKKKRLAASFFFSRGQGDISHAGMFFTTIAAQMAEVLPVTRLAISTAIKEHFTRFDKPLSEQWQHLILGPLKNVSVEAIQLVVVIDALDECDNKDDIRLILRLLAQAKDLKTIRLRVFVTGRPEMPIVLGFQHMPGEVHQDFILHNIPAPIVNHDISTFLQHKLSLVKADHGLRTPWPEESTIQLLVKQAAGLFIYAATTFRFLREAVYPEEQLSLILGEDPSDRSLTGHLDCMYTTILQYSLVGNHSQEMVLRMFKQIVGSIVLVLDVMPARNLAELLQLSSESVKRTLGLLRSVLDVSDAENQPVRILHPSFRDFLLDRRRCLDTRFWIDEKEIHIYLFRNCMELMFKALEQDICDLQAPATLVRDLSKEIIRRAVPLELEYACSYWVNHYLRGNSTAEDNDRILKFLETKFLQWLEIVSMIRKVSHGVRMMTDLELALKGQYRVTEQLLALLYDSKRFILSNRSIVEKAPLQVYYSALMFSPMASLTRKQYHRGILGIEQGPIVQETWSPLLQTLDSHSASVIAVVFSPDGKLVVGKRVFKGDDWRR